MRFCLHPAGKTLLGLILVINIVLFASFTYFYLKYSRLIDQRLANGNPFTTTSKLYAEPTLVSVGDAADPEDLALQLRRTGYSPAKGSSMGWYHIRPDALEVFPGPASFFASDGAVIKFANGKVSQIIALRDNSPITQYDLEPELITNLFDRNREKRRLVHFNDIPPVLVHAVVSAEDKRFFQHSGFDPFRIIKATWRDVQEGRKAEGASTLSMQLARNFWLDPSKTWKRKAAEVFITINLEQKLSKEQIFEYYANQIPLGRRGSFNIHGFGEASQAFFGKDISQLTLPEAALLAGLIQSPSRLNPFKWPDRARARRNVILIMMRENGYITNREYAEAAESPIKLAGANAESTDAPYFVDLVNDQLQQQFQDHDFQTSAYRVYTTLDMNLQRAAAEAVRSGMQEVDEQLKRRYKGKGVLPEAQVALIALDPQTGEVKALVGGRDYGASQLNRTQAKRQPGSVFKPFVYAAALNTGLTEGSGATVFTPVTSLIDEPKTFYYDGRPYEPKNFHHEWHGTVTLRQAIAKSMNIPTVEIAEAVGYRNVVDLARRAGMNLDIRPTPAVALGAYEVTPLEIAGAYTVFANHGSYVKPTLLKLIRGRNSEIYRATPERRPVLDPRVNFLMVDLMQEVMRTGTAAGVRSRGFTLPAAGKTGTSHDGWFAGFTSKLLCVVWVGFDDNTELPLEGARSALPIWTEFMKRAHQFRQYRAVQQFDAPDGVVSVDIDPTTGQLATPTCPLNRSEFFISGTQPVEVCHLHGGGTTQVTGWEPVPVQPAAPDRGAPSPRAAVSVPIPPVPDAVASRPEPEVVQTDKKKRGLFGRIRDIFK